MIMLKMKAARTIDDVKWARITAVIAKGVYAGALCTC